MENQLVIPELENKKDVFNFIVKNLGLLTVQKKMTFKKADGFGGSAMLLDVKENCFKSNNAVANYEAMDQLKTRVAINTTNWMDSHKDVHIPGIWTKNLQEYKFMMHLQEHDM